MADVFFSCIMKPQLTDSFQKVLDAVVQYPTWDTGAIALHLGSSCGQYQTHSQFPTGDEIGGLPVWGEVRAVLVSGDSVFRTLHAV